MTEQDGEPVGDWRDGRHGGCRTVISNRRQRVMEGEKPQLQSASATKHIQLYSRILSRLPWNVRGRVRSSAVMFL